MFPSLIPDLCDKRIVLASGSPRRKNILEKLGFPIQIEPSSFEENLDKSLYVGVPDQYAIDNARFKANDVLERLSNTESMNYHTNT